MSSKIQAIRGMNDLLPETLAFWAHIEKQIKHVASQYVYQEIRTPIVEPTNLFARGIGEVTDIVQKEMYTFNDRNGDNLSLRPEGTASIVRAAIQHGLLHNQTQKLWYLGPMFRHERPQKGRYRQFYQFGVEAFGFPGIAIEAEQLLMTKRLWSQLKIDTAVTLEINTIGTSEERQSFHEALAAFFSTCQEKLSEDEQLRAKTNPLRLLDSKNPDIQSLLKDAPKLWDHLTLETKERFQSLLNTLDELNITYTVNPRLVRGLDYYSHTVFEWTTDLLGAQGTVCAGGRYDRLISLCGGKPSSAFGFALGMERLHLLLETVLGSRQAKEKACDVFVVVDSQLALNQWLPKVESIRNSLPQVKFDVHVNPASFKSQFKRADKSDADFALVIGEDELASNSFTLSFLREKRDAKRLSIEALIAELKQSMGEDK